MKRKEINKILKTESGIILLKKKSKQSFLEAVLNNWISIISALHFLFRDKKDQLILTENRLTLIINNHVYIEQVFMNIESLNYNAIKSSIELIDQSQQFSFPLNKLRISYEESKLIKHNLSEFKSKKKFTDQIKIIT